MPCGLGGTPSAPPRTFRLAITCLSHHKGRDIVREWETTALAVLPGKDHVGAAPTRTLPDNVRPGHEAQIRASWAGPRIRALEPVIRVIQDQESMVRPCRPCEMECGMTRTSSHLR